MNLPFSMQAGIEMIQLNSEIEEIRETLARGGEVEFYIDYKYARTLYKQSKRIDKLERYYRSRSGVYGKSRWYFYLVYVGVMNAVITSCVHKQLEKPLHIYMTAWRYISKVDGRVNKDASAIVTYYGKERKM